MTPIKIGIWWVRATYDGTRTQLLITEDHGAGVKVSMTDAQRRKVIEALRNPTVLTAFEVHGTPVDEGYTLADLRALAGRLSIPGRSKMGKSELVALINTSPAARRTHAPKAE